MQESSKSKTNRQLVCDIIASVHPECDVTDDEVVFGIIYDDYEEYASIIAQREEDIAKALDEGIRRGLEAAAERQIKAPAAPPIDDGVPALGGATIPEAKSSSSIFDIALWA